MKPEYTFKVEGLANKEKVVSGLMESGYIVSCKQGISGYDISVYGKERVDGKGHKHTDWYEKSGITISTTPNIMPAITYFGAPSITSVATISVEDKKDENMETVIKAIERNYGC
jgi:hypothetical protein